MADRDHYLAVARDVVATIRNPGNAATLEDCIADALEAEHARGLQASDGYRMGLSDAARELNATAAQPNCAPQTSSFLYQVAHDLSLRAGSPPPKTYADGLKQARYEIGDIIERGQIDRRWIAAQVDRARARDKMTRDEAGLAVLVEIFDSLATDSTPSAAPAAERAEFDSSPLTYAQGMADLARSILDGSYRSTHHSTLDSYLRALATSAVPAAEQRVCVLHGTRLLTESITYCDACRDEGHECPETAAEQRAGVPDELLPCPFCGSEPRLDMRQDETSRAGRDIVDHARIVCDGCDIETVDFEDDDLPAAEMARAFWNTRVAPPLSPAPEAPERTAGERGTVCTGAGASWCPVHGDCVCPRLGNGERTHDSEECPLHSSKSDHDEPPPARTAGEPLGLLEDAVYTIERFTRARFVGDESSGDGDVQRLADMATRIRACLGAAPGRTAVEREHDWVHGSADATVAAIPQCSKCGLRINDPDARKPCARVERTAADERADVMATLDAEIEKIDTVTAFTVGEQALVRAALIKMRIVVERGEHIGAAARAKGSTYGPDGTCNCCKQRPCEHAASTSTGKP